MKIQQTELTEKHKMKPVTYIPTHAKGDAGHKDCDRGYITSWNNISVFVRYNGSTSAATDPKDLVWG